MTNFNNKQTKQKQLSNNSQTTHKQQKTPKLSNNLCPLSRQ